MGKKFALNIVYNIGLIVSVMGMVWSVQNKHYLYALLLLASVALFLYLKTKLLKAVREEIKDRQKP